MIATFLPFAPSFLGPVSVAVGDVNGDGIPDIIVASGGTGNVSEPGLLPATIKVVDGAKSYMVDANGEIDNAALLGNFIAYDPQFLGGAFVAFARSAGVPEIITGAGFGGGPHVKVIDATKLNELQPNGEIADSALIAQFYAYSPSFGGGVHVAAADLNNDGVADVVTGAGFDGGPHVKVIDGTKLHELQNNAEIADSALLGQFYAYTPAFSGGVFVAADNNNGHPIVVTGAGPPPDSVAAGVTVKVIDATKLNVLDNNSEPTGAALLGAFYPYSPNSSISGAHVATLDFNGDGVADILIGPRASTVVNPVEIVDGTKLKDVMPNQQISASAILDSFFAFGQGSPDGVFVGGGY